MPSGWRGFEIVCSSGEYNGKSCVVFGRVLSEPIFVKEPLVTSTFEVVGDVKCFDAPIGVGMRTSTRVRVGDVEVFTSEDVFVFVYSDPEASEVVVSDSC
jgi:hypothetical protein